MYRKNIFIDLKHRLNNMPRVSKSSIMYDSTTLVKQYIELLEKSGVVNDVTQDVFSLLLDKS